MNDFTFDKGAWAEYLYWQSQDRRTLKKINSLIEKIYSGMVPCRA